MKEHSSYDLVMLIDGSWMLKASGDPVSRGSLQQIVTFMTNKFNFDFSEIEIALSAMDDNSHNKAHFGTNKTFIFTADPKSLVKGLA